MKYLVIYIIVVFLLYTYLKYYCYNDQKNILNLNESKTTDSLKSNVRSELPSESSEPFAIIPYKTFKSFETLNNYKSIHEYDDFEYPLKNIKKPVYEFYSDNNGNSPKINWKSFGTDISSDTVKQKKTQFKFIYFLF